MNNTLALDVLLQPEVAAVPAVPAHVAVPRPLAAMIDDYRPSDVGERFVWIMSSDDGRGRVQLHCAEHAVEAARRAVRRFHRDDVSCRATECRFGHEGGNADPYLFGTRSGDGALLIGYWSGLAGDAGRSRVERWLAELECGQAIDFEL